MGALVHPYSPAGHDIAYRVFRTEAEFRTGTLLGVTRSGGGLVLSDSIGRLDYTDPHTRVTGTYDLASWTSPPVSAGFAATEVIPSWTADTPEGTWIQIDLCGRNEAGDATGWYTLARWAGDDAVIRRTSVPEQDSPYGSVAADTFSAAAGRALASWQLRVVLLRPAGSATSPRLRSIGAAVSRLPERDRRRPRLDAPQPARQSLGPAGGAPPAPTADGSAARTVGTDRPPVAGEPAPASPPGGASGVILDVPRFSQETHTGHYPEWDGGGEAWCSSTSTAMVLAFWGTGPTPDDYSWVDPADPRPWVDHAARQCFDYAYQGAGNWPFNTAYAGRFGMHAFVTRLRSLTEAELFITAGVPLVVSASYRKGDIPGLDYDTRGHLMVLAGFTASGDPVLNDPFSPTDDRVRKAVDRTRFEAAWLAASGGLVYVIHPPSVPLPAPPAQANW